MSSTPAESMPGQEVPAGRHPAVGAPSNWLAEDHREQREQEDREEEGEEDRLLLAGVHLQLEQGAVEAEGEGAHAVTSVLASVARTWWASWATCGAIIAR